MRIAILGGTGYIGSRLCSSLSIEGHEIICISRKLKNINIQHLDRFQFIEYDIFNNSTDINLFDYFNKPDIVIDAAWSNLDDYSSDLHIEKTLKAHYESIDNLISNGLQNLTILGTCAEYGLQEGELNEKVETFPLTNYAKAKDIYRKKVFKLKDINKFKLQWPRLFYFYGLNQPRNAIFSQLMSSNHGTFNMSCGEQVRDYLPIDKLIAYLCKIATSEYEIGIINVCSGDSLSLKETVDRWVQTYNLSVDINLCFYDYSDYEPFSFWGSVSKLKQYNIYE
jgi:nucleoside-diphosphate-sugar epimerase